MANKFKSSAAIIPVEQSVGTILAHDITEIRPGQFKGPAFKKGYIIKKDEIPHLKRVGKEHLYVLHLDPGEVHEDDAALRLATGLAGKGAGRHFGRHQILAVDQRRDGAVRGWAGAWTASRWNLL